MLNNAKAVVILTDHGIDVTLSNWDGVNNSMIDNIQYAIMKKVQEIRARKLGALHALHMKVESSNEERVKTDGDFLKELENAIQE